MGLNRFVWSFGATYPAVAHVSRALGGATKPAAKPAPMNPASGRASLISLTTTAATAATVLAGVAAHRATKRSRQRTRASVPGRLVRVEYVQLTVPYLSLLNFVTHRCEHVPHAEQVQFLLVSSAGCDEDEEPTTLLASAFHDIEPTGGAPR